jgi:hypothetical protein
MQKSDFSDALGLAPKAFAGANLSGAKLPQSFFKDQLDYVRILSEKSPTNFNMDLGELRLSLAYNYHHLGCSAYQERYIIATADCWNSHTNRNVSSNCPDSSSRILFIFPPNVLEKLLG